MFEEETRFYPENVSHKNTVMLKKTQIQEVGKGVCVVERGRDKESLLMGTNIREKKKVVMFYSRIW